jgi:hypothetical protein
VPNTSGIAMTREVNGDVMLTFASRANADDVVLSLETATVLAAFAPATPTITSSVQAGTTLTQTWRIVPPVGATQFFVRLKGTSR